MLYIEYAAIAATVLCVVLTARQHILCWPTGLVAVVLYSFVFFHAKLYSQFGLQFYYFYVQIYGWHHWLHGGQHRDDLPVTLLAPQHGAALISLTFVGALGLGWSMSSFTDASLPFADAFTTVAALVAQWLLARKKLEAWAFWIAVDIVSVRNFWLNDIKPSAYLYAILLLLAAWGFVAWRKSMLAQAENEAEPAA